MDRLLTDGEIKNAVYDTQEKGGVRWPKTVIPRDNKIAKAQDAKTAHLVATQIFKELEEQFGLYETDCNGEDVLVKLIISEDVVMNYNNKSMNQLNIYQAIKSKWGIE